MNILYISKLDGRPWIGPTYSIPKQIKAQAIFDNVMWYNLMSMPIKEGTDNYNEWKKQDYFIDLKEYPQASIAALPAPFSKPDLVIVEQAYPYALDKIRYELIKGKIPYVIIPRGEFSEGAQNKKSLKKKIGNTLLNYYSFVGKALAIQFLTEQEKSETKISWNQNRIVVPNGTDIHASVNNREPSDKINCVFIGRLEPYQKGLDLLIEACSTIKEDLINSNVSIILYGSNMERKLDGIKKLVDEKKLNEVISFHEGVFGEEKAKVLRQADVFLIPSRFEGHPTGLLEALAYGLPCVATTGCNMRQEVEACNAGWGADNTSDSISKALIKMLNEKDLFAKKGANAYKLAMAYDWSNIAKKSHELYEKILESGVKK